MAATLKGNTRTRQMRWNGARKNARDDAVTCRAIGLTRGMEFEGRGIADAVHR